MIQLFGFSEQLPCDTRWRRAKGALVIDKDLDEKRRSQLIYMLSRIDTRS